MRSINPAWALAWPAMTKNVARAPSYRRQSRTRGVQTGSGPSSKVRLHVLRVFTAQCYPDEAKC